MSVNALRLQVFGLCALFLVGSASAQYPTGHPDVMSSQEYSYVLKYRKDAQPAPIEGEIPIKVTLSSTPIKLGKIVTLPGGAGAMELVRVLPLAAREQNVEIDKDGKSPPAVEVSIDGPSQSLQTWLIADDPARDRLASLIAGWGYAAVPTKEERNRLFTRFATELTRPPTVSISRPDGSGTHQMQAEKGVEQDAPELGCKIRIKDFVAAFTIDKETKKVTSASDQRLNPAVLVEIESSGKREERWVFARFPDFKMGDGERLPFNVRFDCPTDETRPIPSFLIVTVGRKRHELWSRWQGKNTSAPLTAEEKVSVPGTDFTFHLAQFVSSGRLTETFSPTDRSDGATAVEVKFSDASGYDSAVWVEAGTRRTLETPTGPIALELNPKASHAHKH